MNLKKFYKILSAIIVIPFGFYVFLWAITDYRYFSFDGFISYIGIFVGIPATILNIVHIYQIKKQKQRNDVKNDSKESPHLESKDDKNLLGMIQERLAKGEISLNEYQELKKEISS